VNLAVRRKSLCPPEMPVFVAHLAWSTPTTQSCDRTSSVYAGRILGSVISRGYPVLAVEVLSPSTRRLDLAFKRARCEAAGCPSYWVVDPLQPSIACWELEEEYREVGRAVGSKDITLTRRFPFSIAPADLQD